MQLTLVRGRFAGQPMDPRCRGDSSAVSMRRIGEADLESVGRLYAVCWSASAVGDETAAITEIRAAWHGEYGVWLRDCSLIAELDGRPIAAVLVVDLPPWDDVSDLVFVIDLFTEPDHRRRGLGEALLAASLNAIDTDRIVGLRVDSENTAAVSLYRKLGFGDR